MRLLAAVVNASCCSQEARMEEVGEKEDEEEEMEEEENERYGRQDGTITRLSGRRIKTDDADLEAKKGSIPVYFTARLSFMPSGERTGG